MSTSKSKLRGMETAFLGSGASVTLVLSGILLLIRKTRINGYSDFCRARQNVNLVTGYQEGFYAVFN